MTENAKIMWCILAGIAGYVGIVGLYLLFGTAGALVIPLATLVVVATLLVRGFRS